MPDVTTPGAAPPGRRTRWPLLLGLGFGIDFLDTLGIGSFATTTTALKLGKLVKDEDIPGTLNTGHALPTLLEAVLYITVIRVELVTLVSMLAAGAIGAWFGAGIVSRLPRRKIQLGMAVALLVTAVFITLRQLEVFPPGGEALALSGVALLIGVTANLVLGALATLGIGNYAPSMAVVSLLGMNPTAAFPIMMGSAALILPAAAVRFVRSGRYDKPTAIAMTLGGIPGVLVAAFIVKSLSLDAVRWLVVAVLLYTSVLMWLSARNEARAGGLNLATS
ncbi:MAG: sulfite exporter TauE/SafE family protein [Gemmatimonadetes bacterium]|nr:sulfite exporter TauE/SafE family protein [Gemmatimonadota bacterium]